MSDDLHPLPLRQRLRSALELAPMTIAQLARCLCARAHYVERLLAEMRRRGQVRYSGRMRVGSFRPHHIWEIAR